MATGERDCAGKKPESAFCAQHVLSAKRRAPRDAGCVRTKPWRCRKDLVSDTPLPPHRPSTPLTQRMDKKPDSKSTAAPFIIKVPGVGDFDSASDIFPAGKPGLPGHRILDTLGRVLCQCVSPGTVLSVFTIRLLLACLAIFIRFNARLVHNTDEMANRVLPAYFKSQNLCSFIRQVCQGCLLNVIRSAEHIRLQQGRQPAPVRLQPAPSP